MWATKVWVPVEKYPLVGLLAPLVSIRLVTILLCAQCRPLKVLYPFLVRYVVKEAK